MFQPLSILRQGYRSVLDRSALVTDTWPASSACEFRRKVRTLAGNFQLIAAAIAGFFAFLFTRGPLWKIWSPTASPMFQEQV